ncbi:mitochondrial carrier protein Mtm1p [[Candida] railenensis]|uniref:Mitochondrial thiamine pyrophosphate carrier 1 n=1 Tax=[Candida] railenensis TaxID=45579 RepID=A0A9P0QQV6_9ASCO|nr:mitochondrial carrier protein Mtm1p [[Candida] railenensis]
MSFSSDMATVMDENDVLRAIEYGKKMQSASPPPHPSQSESENITLTQRMISACSGSFITSLVVTPFDVVRIRMQQQEILPSNCCDGPQESALKAPAGNSGKSRLTPLTMSAQQTEPFWISQHYCKSENCTKINSTFSGFVTISKNEGVPTLWRGLSLTLLMAIPANIIYFTGYEYIRDHSPISDHVLNPLLCGSVARTMAATFIAPVELIKTRLQSIPAEARQSVAGGSSSATAAPKMLSHLLRDSFALVNQRGIGTLFTGLQITLWRDVPFSGIYWSSYELFKDRIGKLLSADFNSSQDDDLRVFATSFLSGSISGTIAALCTNPFDVGKTRLQITTSANEKRPTMFKFLMSIYQREGMGALYSGIWPRIMKIAPSCAIMISSYEIGKKFFKKENTKY